MTGSVYTKAGLLNIIDALPLAIAVMDKDRRVVLANRKILLVVNKEEDRLIGYVGGEAFGCIHHNDAPRGCGYGKDCLKCKIREALLETLEKKKTLNGVEAVMEFKDLGERCLRVSTSPMVLNHEEVALLSVEDITEAKIHEQTRLEKEKLSAALKTAGAVCHELNQPLMVILGFSEILLEDLPKDAAQRRNILSIKEQADRLGSITHKLMSMTRFKTKTYLSGEIIDIDAASEGNDEPDKGREP
nr:histidine kinase [Desulfobacula sp.]